MFYYKSSFPGGVCMNKGRMGIAALFLLGTMSSVAAPTSSVVTLSGGEMWLRGQARRFRLQA